MLGDSSCLTPHGTTGGRLLDHPLGGQSPQLRPNPLDRQLCLPATHGEEVRPASLVLQHPTSSDLAALTVREDLGHPLLDAIVYHPRPRVIVAVLGGVRNRVAHL